MALRWTCEKCGHEVEVIVETRAPTVAVPCIDCGTPMILDREGYLERLRTAGPPAYRCNICWDIRALERKTD